MKRVGRMKRHERKSEIVRLVTRMQRDGYHLTTNKLARRMGLTCSSWLYTLLAEMHIECRIDYDMFVDTHGRSVYHWKLAVHNDCKICHGHDEYCNGCCENKSSPQKLEFDFSRHTKDQLTVLTETHNSSDWQKMYDNVSTEQKREMIEQKEAVTSECFKRFSPF